MACIEEVNNHLVLSNDKFHEPFQSETQKNCKTFEWNFLFELWILCLTVSQIWIRTNARKEQTWTDGCINRYEYTGNICSTTPEPRVPPSRNSIELKNSLELTRYYQAVPLRLYQFWMIYKLEFNHPIGGTVKFIQHSSIHSRDFFYQNSLTNIGNVTNDSLTDTKTIFFRRSFWWVSMIRNVR